MGSGDERVEGLSGAEPGRVGSDRAAGKGRLKTILALLRLRSKRQGAAENLLTDRTTIKTEQRMPIRATVAVNGGDVEGDAVVIERRKK